MTPMKMSSQFLEMVVIFTACINCYNAVKDQLSVKSLTSIHFARNCSTKFCGFDPKCSAFKFCNCSVSSNDMICTEFSHEPLSVLTFQKVLSFSCSRMESAHLQGIVKYFRSSIKQLNVEGLKLDRCCLNNSYFKLKNKLKSNFTLTGDIPVSKLNFSIFNDLDVIKKLTVTNNCLTSVSGPAIVSLPNLTELDLSNNFLTTFPITFFQGLDSLKELNLSFNELKELLTIWLKDLKSLKILRLNSNKLLSLPENIFDDLTRMENLFLGNNLIKTLPENLLFQCQALKQISISSNNFETLPGNFFAKLLELEFVDVSHSKLETLPKNLLLNVKTLKKIYLYKSKLREIPSGFFNEKPNLLEVDLSDNELTYLASMKFTNYGTPVSISLIRNKFQTLQLPLSSIWKGSIKLDFSNNCFDDVSISKTMLQKNNASITEFKCSNCCLTNLAPELALDVADSLVIPNNNVSVLEFDNLQKFSHLSVIDLSFNSIETINFPQNKKNESLDELAAKTKVILDWNKLNCSCENWPFIKNIFRQVSKQGDFEFGGFVFEVKQLFCLNPAMLKGKAIGSLKSDDISCNKTIADGCPQHCWCVEEPGNNRTIITCSSFNLTAFPSDIPFNTNINLKLNDNVINSLPSANSSFWGKLESINLTKNQIESLEGFTIGVNLKCVYLADNRLNNYEPELKKLLSSGSTLTLSGNPWECSCRLVEMKDQIFQTTAVIDKDNLTCWDSLNAKSVIFRDLTTKEYCRQTFDSAPIIFLCVIIVLCTFVPLAVIWYYRRKIRMLFFTNGSASSLFQLY